MSDLSVEQSLEEVDVEKELKQQEAEGEDTGSIVLSESGNESSAEEETEEGETEEEETEEAETTTPDDDSVTQGSTKESQSKTDDNTPSEAAESTSEEAQENLTPTVEEVAEATAEAETAESVAQAKLATALGEELSISSDEDTDDEDNETMKKLEQDINKDILYTYHPEIKQINYRELLTLSQVTRNKKGIIVDPLHTTLPFLTRYEKAKILGLRAKQINHGSKPFVNVPTRIIDGHIIAKLELNAQKIPFIIRRPMPNGGSEYWQVKDLKIID